MFSHVENHNLRHILEQETASRKQLKEALEISWDHILTDMTVDDILFEHRMVLYVNAQLAYKNDNYNLAHGLLKTLWLE